MQGLYRVKGEHRSLIVNRQQRETVASETRRILWKPMLVRAVQYADNNLAAWRVSGLVNRKSRWTRCEGPPTVGSGVFELDSPLLLSKSV